MIAGGSNGWWIAPSDGPTTVRIGWTAQAPLNAALAFTVAMAFGCVVIACVDKPARGGRPVLDQPRWQPLGASDGIKRSAVAAAAWVGLAALFVSPGYGWWGLLGGAVVLLTRRIRLAAWFAVAAMVRVALDVIWTVWRDHPPANPGFPGTWEHLHRFGQFVAVSLLVSTLAHRNSKISTEESGQI